MNGSGEEQIWTQSMDQLLTDLFGPDYCDDKYTKSKHCVLLPGQFPLVQYDHAEWEKTVKDGSNHDYKPDCQPASTPVSNPDRKPTSTLQSKSSSNFDNNPVCRSNSNCDRNPDCKSSSDFDNNPVCKSSSYFDKNPQKG